MISKKGQIGIVFYALMVIAVTGFILNVFSPVINEVRIDLIESQSLQENPNVLMNIIIYGLLPYIWIMYILLSMFLIIFAVNLASRSPF